MGLPGAPISHGWPLSSPQENGWISGCGATDAQEDQISAESATKDQSGAPQAGDVLSTLTRAWGAQEKQSST